MSVRKNLDVVEIAVIGSAPKNAYRFGTGVSIQCPQCDADVLVNACRGGLRGIGLPHIVFV